MTLKDALANFWNKLPYPVKQGAVTTAATLLVPLSIAWHLRDAAVSEGCMSDPHNDFDKYDRAPVCRCGHERDDHDSRTEMRRGEKAYVQKCAHCSCEVFTDKDGPLSRMMRDIAPATNVAYGEMRNERDAAVARAEAAEAALRDLRAAATKLYIAGHWSSPDVPAAEAVALWTALRDAAALPEGTATKLGVGADVRACLDAPKKDGGAHVDEDSQKPQ